MGRWLSQLRAEETNAKTLVSGTDKTDKNSSGRFSSVLSVPHMAKNEKFRPAPMPTADDLQAAFEERAAILEYEEGLPRAEAERVASELVHGSSGGGAETTGGVSSPPPQRHVADVAAGAKSGGAPTISQRLAADADPVAGPGITIVPLAKAVPSAEYDRHLDALIAAAGADTTEGKLLAFKKRKGAVVYRGQDRIFTRGRM